MALNLETKHSKRTAYVLKLRGDATPAALAGRIEHLVSGRQVEFSSADELVESIVRELDAGAVEPDTDSDRDAVG